MAPQAHPFDYPFPGDHDPGTAAIPDLASGLSGVLAIGSNAARGVLRRKMARFALPGPEAVTRVAVAGVAVGHSAHLSPPGFIPAAPFACEGSLTEALMLWLTDDQRAALDRTEPGYVRRRLHPGRHPVFVRGGVIPAAEVYVSRWGVLGPPGVGPWPLSPQRVLHRELGSEHPAAVDLAASLAAEFVSDTHGGDPARDVAGLTVLSAQQDRCRERIRHRLRAAGWAHPHGLGLIDAQ